MIINSRSQAIRNLYNNVVTIDGDDAFDKDHKKITLDESSITTEIKRIEDEYDAQEYARKRQAEYPSIEELVVALYDTDDKSAIEAKRAEVKKKYPKPS
tara:strand:+ start:551 stop:847 length:297 start_codon:yes stop_codon:yes gene_type:complete